MNSSRCSRVAIVALFAVTLLAVPVVAVNVTETGVPDRVQVNETVGVDSELSFTLTDLYSRYDSYQLIAQTDLHAAVWTVTTKNPQGQTIAQTTQNGSNVTVQVGGNVDTVVVELEGRAPPPSTIDFQYQPPQSVTIVAFSQRQQGGVASPIEDPITARIYTEESAAARTALDEAAAAIEEAEAAGAGVTEATNLVDSAVEAYNSGEFGLAKNLAEQAESNADDAAAAQSQQSLLLLIGGAVIALLIVGGIVYWYLQNRGPADKLG
ncbi:MAG: hypothetical protein ABEJ57_09560 [Halobacteriaceae archaeon]